MPYCPACRSEYREGFDRCADCGVDLVAKLPSTGDPDSTHSEKEAGGGWSLVFLGDARSMEILRSILEPAGIETLAPDQNTPQIGGDTHSTRGEVRLFVPTADLPKVKEILREDSRARISENEEDLLRLPCSCGQMLEVPVQTAGTQIECPYCKRTLTVPEIP